MSSIIELLRRRTRLVATSLRGVQLSLVIASCALLVSLAQFYYGNLFARSELGGFISHFSSFAHDIEERDDQMRFDIRSKVGISLVNSGNRPSALLGLYYVFPPGFGDDCSTMPKLDGELVGKSNLFDIGTSYVAYPVTATTVAPGSLSATEATLEIKGAIRDKKDIGLGKPICLVFLALDHPGKLHITTVFVGLLYIYANTSGYRSSSKLRSLADLMSGGS